ncbi:hypothetical protein AAX26_01677 [Aliarcobacter thereius]|uniref:Uncharacterized protein n=2 Tax=Aliarcobacter thereius TaxID=544718 RepID=A0A1C0B3U4_9BACT|nr:hypothetical protein [Aliarcobacter thereius]OCL86026.1 hypothetical protein AAX26_01677 [Aliarcobacter thereius]OCL90508.1 hypothetical protein AAX25_01603 [Aliarcobacter thereius]OCL95697.1 hypothetical protein AA347_01175 [Aliarcobacter thereius LMG 24486]OCL96951.1 hypothetical protein AAX29_01991 [Aliarcobacter thereius]QBF16319.1 hypothetical protein ATH_1272 [Aliarcobacter thereius LMG 24486]
MNFSTNEKQERVKYIRVLEKFFTKTISLLKLENFDKELFLKRTEKNYEDFSKTKKVELYSEYYAILNGFVEKVLSYLKNSSETFEEERAILLKEANLLQKEKNKTRYKKDKHKKDRYDDGN